MNIQASQDPIDFHTLELLPLGVVVVNAQGTVLFYNQREEEISGRRREDVVGRNFFQEVAPCTEVSGFAGRFRELMAQGGEGLAFDFTFPFTLGARRVRINLHPFRKDQEGLCVIFVADLTEREQLRERLLQSQRFSELGEVAAKVAHNFNNLLSVVQMSSELAMEQGSPEVRKHMARVLEAVKEGTALVGRYRGIARSGHTLAQDQVDLNTSVATAADFARQFAEASSRIDGRQVGVRVNLAEGALMVLGDGGELREALLNLLRNAIEAIPEQGTVRILTSREAGMAVVDIIDDGLGMPPDVLSKLFTPMFTTKDYGTGLGLASAHAAIRHYGGTIEVNSVLGQGSHFHLILPEASAEG
jgi:two-component system sensor histidine kinase PilS (NtrC family)